MSMDECIEKELKGCTQNKALYYYCGASSECTKLKEVAVQKAKHNIEKYYTFIGLNEELNDFWWGLERQLPKYFKGLVQHLSRTHFTNQSALLVGKKKPPLQEKSAAKLRDLLRYDIELYSFIRQRYHNTMLKLKLDDEAEKHTTDS